MTDTRDTTAAKVPSPAAPKVHARRVRRGEMVVETVHKLVGPPSRVWQDRTTRRMLISIILFLSGRMPA